MKIKNQIFLLSLACLALCGCSPTLPMVIDEEIDYSQEVELTGNEYAKLSYLLEGVIDLENDLPDTWNKPLSCDCGGMLRPDVTLYEEQLPQKAWQESVIALRNADLFIIGGTSLTVYPANTLIQYYGGNKIVIINRDVTSQDRFANILFHENLGTVFKEIKA